MQKREKKNLDEKVKNWDNSLSAQDKSSVSPHLAAHSRLAQKRPTKKSKGALSAKALAKYEAAWILSYLRPIEGVGTKEKTNPETPKLRAF
ncbi:hypothetical protein GmHk_10G030345 [Glycine max]|nr:hypothetical protein GmHk_10G030345 [Glycine max]